MLNNMLAGFYERDIRKMIAEIELFKSEENLWKTVGSVKNPAGNLALHIVGGLNYLVGATLAKTGYVRNRDLEFTKKDVPGKEIISGLEDLIDLINKTLNNIDMNTDFPFPFDGETRTNGYVLTQLSLHLNYHLGQVNYLRRVLE